MIGASDGITVWTLAIDALDDAVWPHLEASLDAAERDRAGRFVFPRHKRAYIAAHALKRRMLTVASGGSTRAAAWRFAVGAHGKPRVIDDTAPHFNMSHCEGLVAVAVCSRVEIGIDVESLDRPAPLEIADSYFARSEVALLRGLPEPLRRDAFFRLWTLKEAWLKATGLGLSQSLQDFAFAFNPLRIAFESPALGEPSTWHFQQWQLSSGHLLALAWASPAPLAVEVRAFALGLDQQGRAVTWTVTAEEIDPLTSLG